MATVTLLLFCLILTGCVLLRLSITYALAAGFIIFCLYARYCGFHLKEIARMSFSGVRKVQNILIIFLFIGMLTGVWRACGTIPVIVCFASSLLVPQIFILATFLLNCFVSILTGTAFGTVATMGVICMTMANTMQISPILTGGAILSGIFFGDRCSPVSTSALLVSELTQTSIYTNIRLMIRTALVPFLITCAIYTGAGILSHTTLDTPDITSLFSSEFSLHWLAILPAAIILLLSLFRTGVKKAMLASILAASLLCIFLQNQNLGSLLSIYINGYHSTNPELSSIINGGGILSMVKVAICVCLSSSYSGIFEATGLLDNIKNGIHKLSEKITVFGAILFTSLITGMIACNQTLSIMLTNQLCKDLDEPADVFAIDLENSAVVLAPLVPWSIAGAVPLAAVNAPVISIAFACFLYILPVWSLITHSRQHRFKRSQR